MKITNPLQHMRDNAIRLKIPGVGSFALAYDPGEARFIGNQLFRTNLEIIHKNKEGKILELRNCGSGVITAVGINQLAADGTGAGTITPAFRRFIFMDSGTGVTAASAADTALGTPTGIARATISGSKPTQTATAAGAGTTTTTLLFAGTCAYNASFAITEWGLFDASTVGNLWDRRVFAAVNVQNGDSITYNYSLNMPDNG